MYIKVNQYKFIKFIIHLQMDVSINYNVFCKIPKFYMLKKVQAIVSVRVRLCYKVITDNKFFLFLLDHYNIFSWNTDITKQVLHMWW